MDQVTQVVETSTFSYTVIPMLVVGAIVLGILFLIFIVVLAFRGSQVSRSTGGAVALAFASMLFLTGVWCLVLSPMDRRYETVLNAGPSIPSGSSWVYVASFDVDDMITGNVNFRGWQPLYDDVKPTIDSGLNESLGGGGANTSKVMPAPIQVPPTFTVLVYDPQDRVILSEYRTTSSSFTVKAPRSGDYRFKVENDSPDTIMVYVNISKSVLYKPLRPLGEWLSLVSLPLVGLGIWATLPRRPSERQVMKTA